MLKDLVVLSRKIPTTVLDVAGSYVAAESPGQVAGLLPMNTKGYRCPIGILQDNERVRRDSPICRSRSLTVPWLSLQDTPYVRLLTWVYAARQCLILGGGTHAPKNTKVPHAETPFGL